MNKKWEVNKRKEDKIEQVIKENNISPLLASILVNRNIISPQEVQLFLNPTRNDFMIHFLCQT